MSNKTELAPKYPTEKVRSAMHADNNDWERNHNFRGVKDTLPLGGPTFPNGEPLGFSNPAYKNISTDELIATQSPNAFVELANLQNRHDEDERAATLSRIEAIGKPRLNPFKRRELGKLSARLKVIDPTGDMAESHTKFKDANIDALIDNAHAQAAQDEIEKKNKSEEHARKVVALGNVFHEVWIRTRYKRNEAGAIYTSGERDPRDKNTTDKSWSEEHGQTVVDIANTGFVNLPEDWQTQNVEAAEVIITLIEEMGGAEKIDLSDPEIYAKVGSIIHNKWLERNTYAQGGELDVSFSELPMDEQDKDLEQLKISLEIFMPEKDGARPQPFSTRALKIVNNWALGCRLPIRTVDGDLEYPGSLYYEDQFELLMAGKR